MPGIFGVVGARPETLDGLKSAFAQAWPACASQQTHLGGLGGHAHGSQPALHFDSEGRLLAADGERSLYQRLCDYAGGSAREPFTLQEERLSLKADCKGNLAVLDVKHACLYLATEWTGSFPLYYCHRSNELLFSSLLKPLARTVGAAPDPLGLLEFLRTGALFSGRTQFEGIRRMMPGQALRFDCDTGRLEIYETSRAWVSTDRATTHGLSEWADEAWTALRTAVERCCPNRVAYALMMSGGWDSRTLLAALLSSTERRDLTCYSHGDLHSRELRLIAAICRDTSLNVRLQAVTDEAYDPSLLQQSFGGFENVVFPHWILAGANLGKAGVQCVTAGIFGEVLGGHYGPAMMLTGARKMQAVAGALFGSPAASRARGNGLSAAFQVVRTPSFSRLWCLGKDFWRDLVQPQEALNADIEADLQRLVRRGISDPDQLVEAFITESRATQYIAAQLLSCRTHVDVAMPFADQDLFALATRVPLRIKIHNALNRELLRRHGANLLKYPSAASLASARSPLLIQEASRFVRHLWEEGRWRLHFGWPELFGPPRFGWVDFEFLRSGKALRALEEDLCSPIWDRDALRQRIRQVMDGSWRQPAHPISDMFMKIYSVDLLLR